MSYGFACILIWNSPACSSSNFLLALLRLVVRQKAKKKLVILMARFTYRITTKERSGIAGRYDRLYELYSSTKAQTSAFE
jgi:hypothetical protein